MIDMIDDKDDERDRETHTKRERHTEKIFYLGGGR